MRIFTIVALLCGFGAMAKEKPKVIDVGTGETEGTVRKPHVSIVDSEHSVLQLLPELYRKKFESIERENLRPVNAKAQEGLPRGDL